MGGPVLTGLLARRTKGYVGKEKRGRDLYTWVWVIPFTVLKFPGQINRLR
jgi:hypothetical protein